VLQQPGIAFFVRAVIVQDHMQFLIRRSFGDDLIHKLQELLSSLQLGKGRLNLSSRPFQCREKIERPVPFIGIFETANDLAVVGFNITGFSFQGLNTRLLILWVAKTRCE